MFNCPLLVIFRNLVLRARSRKYRLQTNEIVIEGISAVQSAMAAGGKLKSLYFSGSDTLQSFNSVDLNDVELYKVRYETVKTCTQTDMPDGVLGKTYPICIDTNCDTESRVLYM